MTLGKQTAIVRGQIEDALGQGRSCCRRTGVLLRPVHRPDRPDRRTGRLHRGPRGNVRPERRGEQGRRHGRRHRARQRDEVRIRRVGVHRRAHRRDGQLPRKLECGVVTVNSVLGFAGIAALPFGGVGDSGFGRIHGADGLREFSRVKSMAVQKFSAPLDLLTIERKARDMKISRWMLAKRHAESFNGLAPASDQVTAPAQAPSLLRL